MQRFVGTLYVDCKSVHSGQLQGDLLYINSLEWLFLGGVPKDFDAKRVPVSGFAASLFNVPCHSVDSITGGVWAMNRSVGVYMTQDEFRPSLMIYTANSLSFSFAFRHVRSRFRVSRVSLDRLGKERLLVVYWDLLMFRPVALLHHSIYKPHPTLEMSAL